VARSADPSDRRRRAVELTESGAALLAEMFEAGERLTDEILLSAGVDVTAFRKSLWTLIDAMEPGSPPR
jgi:DNA-binding MarR family transcriptional regulator